MLLAIFFLKTRLLFFFGLKLILYSDFISMSFQDSVSFKENNAQLNRGRTDEDNTGENTHTNTSVYLDCTEAFMPPAVTYLVKSCWDMWTIFNVQLYLLQIRNNINVMERQLVTKQGADPYKFKHFDKL